LVNKLAEGLFKRNIHVSILYPHVLNKGYVLFPGYLSKERFDFILIHLVDTLPLAARMKRSTNAKLIYDCQEYFNGQYETEAPFKRNWVKMTQTKYAPEADIVLATTNVMLDRLRQEFPGPNCFIRVRNAPIKKMVQIKDQESKSLKIIWHGMTIIPRNIRGVHILLEAVAYCKTHAELFLQGSISEDNRNLLQKMINELGIEGRVFLLPPAHPDTIVESLSGYDIGIAGELAMQDNQRLTSSNKLFEFISAGLAVLVPDLPGLSETVKEYKVGLLYEQGNSKDLAGKIDTLNENRGFLHEFRKASRIAADTELFWEKDYQQVWESMEIILIN
jgi:glycosyltransferase involved in cell wall biosynthesis